MKDLIAGSLGRLDDAGGSKMYTTPRTVYVPPEYEIETDVPSVAEFVTCSLDGRLWVFRRSRRYYVAALRFNELTQRLVFVSTTVLNNTTIVGRGISWVLTDKQFVQALDDEPYVGVADLFADNADTLFYSLILSDDVSQRSNYLQSVRKDYSLLPTVGDWTIVDKFLIHKPTIENGNDDDNEDSSIGIYHSMSAVRPLIPLEFYNSAPVYGNSVSLANINGELWARGKYSIGKCSILPAVFDENGNPQEFYLYISPDYKVSPYLTNANNVITQSEWNNLNVFGMNDAVYGFLTSNTDSLTNGLCHSSDTLKLFIPSDNEWLDFEEHEENEESEQEDTLQNEDDEQQNSSNSKMFVDTFNQSGLVLENDKVSVLNGLSYGCKGIKQWVAPTGNIEAITPNTVISSFDKIALTTHTQQGFYRELLTVKNTPSITTQDVLVSINEKNNRKRIYVNSMKKTNNNAVITCDDAYKHAVDIRFLNLGELTGRRYIGQDYVINSVEYSPLWVAFGSNEPGPSWSAELCYIHPQTGEMIRFTVTTSASAEWNLYYVFIENNKIYVNFNLLHGHWGDIHYVGEIPDIIKPYCADGNFSEEGYSYSVNHNFYYHLLEYDNNQDVFAPRRFLDKVMFYERNSNIKFYVDIASIVNNVLNSNVVRYTRGYILPNRNSYNEEFSMYTEYHCSIAFFQEFTSGENWSQNDYLLGFHAVLHPEIFDFNAEFERSKLT